MDTNLFGAFLAFCIGVAIASVNYGISKRVLKKAPSKYFLTQMIKQVLQIGFLLLLFLLGDRTPWDPVWLLVGGCVGITLPMLLFTPRLVKFNDSLKEGGVH